MQEGTQGTVSYLNETIVDNERNKQGKIKYFFHLHDKILLVTFV